MLLFHLVGKNSDLLEDSWQELDAEEEWGPALLQELKREVEGYSPQKDQGVSEDKIPFVNVLMLGPVGAGKSSFFNTINSFFKERLAIQARAGSADTSLTKTLDIYSVKAKCSKSPLKFRLYDCRGLEDAQSLDSRDIESILDGHVRNGYVFNSSTHISKDNPKYRVNPAICDRIHCVVFVVDANSPPDMIMTEKVQDQVRKLQEMMNYKRIPQLVLLTKVDCLSPVFKKDPSTVFRSQKVLDIVNKVANSLGLPPYSILPMQNISNQQRVSEGASIMALYNLRQILRASDDFLDNFIDDLLPDRLDGFHIQAQTASRD
ncbi:hypothetical protein FSP39_010487 [Pinctada imbricata]|uniref:G domain-containing protein n=1 Tax=Pinctada imbricata TaxID=66713 RepID=A0AA88XW91_PINIB|nr:hypothetical protein FSP39_010487 [Pinctada imbricata]